MKRIAATTLVLAVIGVLCATAVNAQRSVISHTFSSDSTHLHRVKKTDEQSFVIDETTYGSARSGISDLTLSFNGPRSGAFDESGRYRIRYSNYNRYTGTDASGGGAALFFRQEDYLVLESVPDGWSTETDDLGSFSIEFRIRPSATATGAVIFSRSGYAGGRRNGIDITFRSGRLHVALNTLFKTDDGDVQSHEFSVPREIGHNKWYHCVLSYDRTNGLLTFLIDSHEVYSRYMTSDATRSGTILPPAFAPGDIPDIIIARNYSGVLDEFRISYSKYDDLAELTPMADKKYLPVKENERTPVNMEGVVTSPVYEFPHTGTMIRKFYWDEKLPEDSFIWFEIRMDDARFGQFHGEPRWYRITNGQRNIYLHRLEEENRFLRGKYLQWRAHLIPSPDGAHSPELTGVSIDFEQDVPPVPPIGVEVVETGDEYVIIRWKKNVDHDIAGYCIYYGLQSGQYDGRIRYVDGKRIVNTEQDYVQVKIQNKTIEMNRKIDKSNVLTYPLLKNNVLYFFSVSAYDSYRTGTQHNHESDLSHEISARPFAGSQIDAR